MVDTQRRRLGLFSLHCNQGLVEEYVLHALKDISNNLSDLVIVCSGSPDYQGQQELERFSTEILEIQPEASSMLAWQQAWQQSISSESSIDINRYDEILLFDDSFFGPLYSSSNIFNKMDNQDVDFWGISEHAYSPKKSIDQENTANNLRAWYLDPCFLVIRSSMAKSQDFSDYWAGIAQSADSSVKTNHNDYYFTNHFERAGYTWKAFCSTRDQDSSDPSKSHLRYHFQLHDLIINHSYPFIKKTVFEIPKSETLEHNYADDLQKSMQYIEQNFSYDIGLIYRYLLAYNNLEDILNCLNFQFILPIVNQSIQGIPDKKIAVIVYLYYPDLFEYYSSYLSNIPSSIDIYIATNSKEKASLLDGIFHGLLENHLTILVTEGRGRDLSSLLVACREIVKTYEYFCFIHDKKSAQYESQALGLAYGDLLWDNTLKSADYITQIINTFEEKPYLGLLVPPLPYAGRSFVTMRDPWTSCFDGTVRVIRALDSDINLDPQKGPHALGSVFWCRYQALAPLFEVFEWHYDDFPSEPLPVDGSISHSLERCFPYIAQTQGFMTGTAVNTEYAGTEISNFRYMMRETTHATEGIPEISYKSLAKFIKSIIEFKNRLFELDLNPARRFGGLIRKNYRWLKKRIKNRQHIRYIKGSKYFDSNWYLDQYPEVKDFAGIPAEHYLFEGWRKNYDPSASFSTFYYFRRNRDVKAAGICPLLHFEMHGKAEGRPFEDRGLNFQGQYQANSKIRARKRSLGQIQYARSIKKNKDARILVILHIFYSDSWQEIKEYLKNLQPYNYDLIVTYCDGFMPQNVLDDLCSFKPDADIRCVQNGAADIKHFVDVLKTVDLDNYDIVFKAHSKGTARRWIFIYKQIFALRDWFLYLYEGILGAKTVHKTIGKLLKDNNCGMVAADNLIVEDPKHKKNLTIAFMNRWGIPVPDKYRFVAGTCFAVRASLLKGLQNLEVSFESEYDKLFTPALAVERVFCLHIISSGYQICGNKTCRAIFKHRNRHAKQLYALSTEHLLDDNRFTIDDEFFFMALDNGFMKSYEILEMPLGEIKIRYDGKLLVALGFYGTTLRAGEADLSYSAPVRYLNGDKEIYKKYCQFHQENSLPFMTEERFNRLRQSIDQNGFDENNLIVLNHNNIIIDGQHRASYMYYKYGEDYKIKVLKVNRIPQNDARTIANDKE